MYLPHIQETYKLEQKQGQNGEIHTSILGLFCQIFAGLIIYTPAKLHGQKVHWYFRFAGKYWQICTAKNTIEIADTDRITQPV